MRKTWSDLSGEPAKGSAGKMAGHVPEGAYLDNHSGIDVGTRRKFTADTLAGGAGDCDSHDQQ